MSLRALLSLLILTLCATSATAGPNAGGILIVHVTPFTHDSLCDEQFGQICDASNPCVNIDACEHAITTITGPQQEIWVVLAAFAPGSGPRLSGLTFGIYYSPEVALAASATCGDFELRDSGWPASGTGTALTWNVPGSDLLQVVYWFAGYNYYSPQPASFALEPHPSQGGNFGDDSVPSLLDPIAAYGVLGFDQPGSAPCPNQPITGACCFPDCSCQVLIPDDCAAQGGVYYGDGTNCDPNPCSCPPPIGACCLPDGQCIQATNDQCLAQGGDYRGDYIFCQPDPCAPVASERVTWGTIKSRFR